MRSSCGQLTESIDAANRQSRDIRYQALCDSRRAGHPDDCFLERVSLKVPVVPIPNRRMPILKCFTTRTTVRSAVNARGRARMPPLNSSPVIAGTTRHDATVAACVPGPVCTMRSNCAAMRLMSKRSGNRLKRIVPSGIDPAAVSLFQAANP